MHECQILVRLKKRCVKNKYGKQYGNCQICNQKHSYNCVEASAHNKRDEFIVFIFCEDCYSAVNDICSKFVYNKNIYSYEKSYHIKDNPIKKRCKFVFSVVPFIIGGNRVLF